MESCQVVVACWSSKSIVSVHQISVYFTDDGYLDIFYDINKFACFLHDF